MTGMLLGERVVGAWRNTYTLAREPHRAFRSSRRVRKGRTMSLPPVLAESSITGNGVVGRAGMSSKGVGKTVGRHAVGAEEGGH